MVEIGDVLWYLVVRDMAVVQQAFPVWAEAGRAACFCVCLRSPTSVPLGRGLVGGRPRCECSWHEANILSKHAPKNAAWVTLRSVLDGLNNVGSLWVELIQRWGWCSWMGREGSDGFWFMTAKTQSEKFGMLQ